MQNDNVKIQREKFLRNEVATMSILGGFMRANIYKKYVGDKKEKDKNDFRKFIREKLEEYGVRYRAGGISEDQHFLNIEKFANEITIAYGRLLKDNKFRIGTAQKVLNLYLKYFWAIWEDVKIFHCPFDSRIIGKLRGVRNECKNYTQFDSMECYRELVAAGKEEAKKAGYESIAEWELKVWNSTNDANNF